ncbi:uncharacterized protein LOC115235256 [Formica exsecta]|uniref:uncharacterized protein LOC115235256 n=1 Tax=Formica exsecta TaxID=72781 RepID=UPI00114126C1|nr:uncharacterized protein LOC115235256 [Formica exsecta]
MNRKSKIKCGFCGWIINVGSCANIEKHKCFEKYREELHLLHIDENHVATMIPRYGHNKNSEINTSAVIRVENNVETKSDDGTDETLIELVFERPALWNYKLPLQDRTNLKKDALWLEVSNRMGGGDLI